MVEKVLLLLSVAVGHINAPFMKPAYVMEIPACIK